MKKTLSKILFIFLTFLIGTTSVLASAPNTITVGEQTRTSAYLTNGQGLGVLYRKSTNGDVIYCMNWEKTSPATGNTLTLGSELDAGLTYLLTNGYPSKSFYNDAYKDYYVTQMAIWMYQGDNGHQMSSLVTKLKNGTYSGSATDMANTIKTLYNNAVAAKQKGYTNPTFSLSDDSIVLNEEKSYYISKLITASGTNVNSTYNVTLSGAPDGTIITNSNGNTTNTINLNDGFYVKVPVANVSAGSTINFTVNVSINGFINKAYLFNSNNTAYQDMSIAAAYPVNQTLNDSLTISASKEEVKYVKISKQDITSKEELPGATLIIKDANGNTIDQWVSGSEPHYIYNLKDGIYTLTEISSPDGYELSSEEITFEVSDGKATTDVVMYNERTKEETTTAPTQVVEVKKTGLNSTLFYGISAIILALGIYLVYRHKNA